MEEANGKAAKPNPNAEPVYVNHCTIDADLSDAKLTFAQAGDGQQQPVVKARLVTSPTHMKRFRDVIADACAKHDEQFSDGRAATGQEGGD